MENGCVVVRATPMELLDLRTEFWTTGVFLCDSGSHDCGNGLVSLLFGDFGVIIR